MISFGLGFVLFVVGSAAIALCIVAMPGPRLGGEAGAAASSHGHGTH